MIQQANKGEYIIHPSIKDTAVLDVINAHEIAHATQDGYAQGGLSR